MKPFYIGTPQIFASPPGEVAISGCKTLFVTCIAVGAGLDIITFTINGRTISPDSRTNITQMVKGCPTERTVTATLELCGISQEDAGMYSCTASSAIGSDSANFKVVVSDVGM